MRDLARSFRLYNPTQGRIMVDNNDLRELDPSHWRRMIGTVGQEPVLFSTTIRNNIVYGSERPDEISDEQVCFRCSTVRNLVI